jgi:hypothetical protein
MHKMILKTAQYASVQDIQNFINPRERLRLIDE